MKHLAIRLFTRSDILSDWSRIALCVPMLLGALFLTGCQGCDPDAHINLQNNYAVPVNVRRLGTATQKLPDQILDTVPPGKRVELANNPGLDGDIDNLQIEDQQGHILTRLSTTGKNVICKQKTPEYVWEVTVGP